MRVALGAHRGRLVLQYFVESMLLAALGGLAGLVCARWGVAIMLSMLPMPVIPEALAFHANGRILGFAILVSLASGLLFGLTPAWRTTHVDLANALRSSHGTAAPRARHIGRALVASQVGLSVVLLVAAGLFVQTLRNLSHVDVGFNPDNLLQVLLDTRGSGYQRGQVGPLHRLLIDRVSAIPGVTSVTTIRNQIMQGALSRGSRRSRATNAHRGGMGFGRRRAVVLRDHEHRRCPGPCVRRRGLRAEPRSWSSARRSRIITSRIGTRSACSSVMAKRGNHRRRARRPSRRDSEGSGTDDVPPNGARNPIASMGSSSARRASRIRSPARYEPRSAVSIRGW